MRCFIASPLPPRYRQTVLNFVPELTGVRWVHHDKYHVTLRFLGNTSQENIPDHLDEVNQYKPHFPLLSTKVTLSGFPRPERARVIVLLLKSDGKFEAIRPSDSRFVPHLTLGYSRGRPVKVPKLSSSAQIVFESVGLYESIDGKYRQICCT